MEKGKGGSVVYIADSEGSSVERTGGNLEIDSCGQVTDPALKNVLGCEDLFQMFPVDAMHNIYLGNARYLTNKLFSKKAKGMALRNAADSVLEVM